jgi:HPt (histidine-containing phosphotransfer) domain-containing protein
MQGSSEGHTFNVDVLRAAVSNNHGLAERVADAFLKIKPELQSRLTAAVLARDLQTATRAAHELRGMAGMMGARQLAQVAAAIETCTKDAALDGVADLQIRLIAEWDAVATALGASTPTTSG